MTDRRNPRSCVARTVEGPPTRPKERTTQTHPAHRAGSLQDTPTDGRQTHGLRLTMNCASELDTGMDHDAELEHVHGPEPACMIEHRHTPSPAQQGAQIGTAGGRVDYALALGQRRTRGPELDTELDHGADPAHVHRPKPALVTDHKGTPLHDGAPHHGGHTGQHGTTAATTQWDTELRNAVNAACAWPSGGTRSERRSRVGSQTTVVEPGNTAPPPWMARLA